MPSSPPPPSFDPAKAAAKVRSLALQRLLPLWPHEIADRSPEGRRKLIASLRRALREERRHGLCGHWAYDLARHSALLRLYRAELASDPAQAERRMTEPPVG